MITSAVVKVWTIVNEILNSILVNLRLFSSYSTLCSLTLRIGRTRPTSFANRVRPENLAEMEFLPDFSVERDKTKLGIHVEEFFVGRIGEANSPQWREVVVLQLTKSVSDWREVN